MGGGPHDTAHCNSDFVKVFNMSGIEGGNVPKGFWKSTMGSIIVRKKKKKKEYIPTGRKHGERDVSWTVNGLISDGVRKRIAVVKAYTADNAMQVARTNQPEGSWPLSVKRTDGTGPEVYEL